MKTPPDREIAAGVGYRLDVLIFALLLVIAVYLQWGSGAYVNEFGDNADEAAHYVTGLMVRDFILSGDWRDPLQFAEQYYVHYPKVAFGHWGPVFYLVQGVWGLACGVSRTSVLVLMALITAALALVLYRVVKRSAALPVLGFVLGVALITNMAVQRYTSSIMTEQLSSLLMFSATLAFAGFLATEKWRYSVAFGALASLAILTKGNGLLLALVPFVSLLLGGRWQLLRQWKFWFPAVLVAAICGPWHFLTLDLQRNGLASRSFDLGFVQQAIPYYAYHMLTIAGVGFSLLVGIAVLRRVVGNAVEDEGFGHVWTACLALVVSVFVFHCLVPCGLDSRHLIPAIPAVLVCSVPGLMWIARAVRRTGSPQRLATALALVAMAVTPVASGRLLYTKSCRGFSVLAQNLDRNPEFAKSVFLVSSDDLGDGMFVSEVAMRDCRPNRVVLRASKSLASSRWDKSDHRLHFQDADELMGWIREIPVGVVVVDKSAKNGDARPEHRQLEEAIQANPSKWYLWGVYPLVRKGKVIAGGVEVWILRGNHHAWRRPIRIDMTEMLGKVIELEPS